MRKKNFIYKNKIYSFNIDSFNIYSDFFSRNWNENEEKYYLVSEYDCRFDLSDESINAFIQFCQNQEIEITNDNVISLNFLSKKYNVRLLIKMTDEYIKVHHKELINLFLSFDLKKIQQENITQFEDIISNYFQEIVSDDRLLEFNMSSIYRILIKYYSNKKNNENNQFIQHKIIEFLFKYIEIHGTESSFLFSFIDIGDEESEYMCFMLCKYYDIIDFKYIKKIFFQGVNFLFKQQQINEEKQKELRQMIEDQKLLLQSQITNIYSNIGKIELPEKTKIISANQFRNFSFKELMIPQTVEIIEENAFNGCSSLVQIIIPKFVEFIGLYAFAECSSLAMVTIQAKIDSIKMGTFLNCSSLTQISIPSSVKVIGNSAFKGCSSLSQLLIPASVECIESYSFADCSSLEQISIPSSLKFIGSFAFNNCKLLHQIDIPSINSIENGTFYGCSSLDKITIPSSVTKICDEAFRGCQKLKKIKIPSSVIFIGSYVFVNCKLLDNIVFPSVTTIEKGLFYGCSSLSQFLIPDSVTRICNDAFNQCLSLNQLIIPSSVKFIGNNAFEGCTLLDEPSRIKISELMNHNKKDQIKTLIHQRISDTIIPIKYNQIKKILIDYLNDSNSFDENKILFLEEIVKQFLKEANSVIKCNKSSQINWPLISDYQSEYNGENIKLFEIFIWYSQIYSILEEISDGKDVVSNLLKLIEFDEMINISEILFSNLINNGNLNKLLISVKDTSNAFSILNSYAIIKLLELNNLFITDPEQIFQVINSYVDREECDINEVKWIFNKLKKLPTDFELKMPNFEPKDLIFLISNEKLNSGAINGPFCKEIENKNNFFNEILLLTNKKFKSFLDASVSISQIAYRLFIYSNDEPPRSYDEMRIIFDRDEILTEENHEIVEKLRIIFKIAYSLERMSNQQLILSDLSVLSENWINNSDLLNKFPSILFWFCKNKQCADQIIEKSLNYSIKDNRIPIWLIALRILSSKDCISFESNLNNNSMQIINRETSNIVKQYLNDAKILNKLIDYDWINILISEVPVQILNPDIKIIHDFFILLSKEKYNFQSIEVKQFAINIFQDAISKITELILSNKLQEIMTKDLSYFDFINQFLLFPSEYMINKIKNHIDIINRYFLEKQSVINLAEYLNSLEIFQDIIQNINNTIIEEENEMKICIDIAYSQREKNEIEYIKQSLIKYNQLVSSLTSNMKRVEFFRTVKKLTDYQKSYQDKPELFKKEGILISYIIYDSSMKVKIVIKKNGNKASLILPQTGNYYRHSKNEYYFFPDEEFLKDENKNLDVETGSILFQYINEEANIKEIFPNKFKSKKIYPTIFFNDLRSEVFKKIISNLFEKLISFKNIFYRIINKNEILPKDDSAFKDILCKIRDILQLSNVRFVECKKIPKKTQSIIQGRLKDYLQNLESLLIEVMKAMERIKMESSPYLKFLKSYKPNVPINELNLMPEQISNFSLITNIDPIIQPILVISPENKIICTIKKLKYSIGTIFPSLIKSNISINIISFIKENISCNINCKNHPFTDIIYIDKYLIEHQTISVIIDPSKIELNEPKIIELKGDLNIKVGSYEIYALPFEITMEILPLKVIIRCLEYKLADEHQSLRLCCDKVIPGDKINFEISNLYDYEKINFSVDLESLDGNEANQPKLFVNNIKRYITLTIPHSFDCTRCHFKIMISFSKSLIVTLHCDFIIVPLNKNLGFIKKTDALKEFILSEESKRYQSFILSENETPKPLNLEEYFEANTSNSIKNEQPNILDLIESDLKLPSIELPHDISISNLRMFYINCSFGAAILPVCILQQQLKKEDHQDSEFFFSRLLEIKNKLAENQKNKSVLSKYINLFIDSFDNCAARLKESWKENSSSKMTLNFGRMNKQNFIIFPEIGAPKINHIKWENQLFTDKDTKYILEESLFINEKLKGQKILIVLLYDCRINLEENPHVSSKAFFEPGNIAEAVGFFGIEIFVVHNYKDAISELTKQTKPGFCDYYATWVISGLPYDIQLPDGGNQHFVNQFIDCLIQFWKNRGSVVMFSDGDPLTFQTNLFLEKITFNDGMKTRLRIGGRHKGKKFIPFYKFIESDIFKNFQRAPLSFNIKEIYEGESISFAIDDESIYAPFTPFMKDSENGISVLFYAGDQNLHFETGDIIIDCGFSKLFAEMPSKAIFKYIQNVAGWTVQCESKHRLYRIKPNEFRPKAVIFTLDEFEKCNLVRPPKLKEIKIEKDFNLIESIQAINSIDQFMNLFESLLNASLAKMRNNSKDDNLKNNLESLRDRLNKTGDLNDEINRRISILIGISLGEIKNIFENDSIVAMAKEG